MSIELIIISIDFHGQIGDADARPWRPPEWNEAAPVPAMSQIVFVQPPAGAAHPRPHGWKTLSLLLLRSTFQAAQSRPAAHTTPYRSVTDFLLLLLLLFGGRGKKKKSIGSSIVLTWVVRTWELSPRRSYPPPPYDLGLQLWLSTGVFKDWTLVFVRQRERERDK